MFPNIVAKHDNHRVILVQRAVSKLRFGDDIEQATGSERDPIWTADMVEGRHAVRHLMISATKGKIFVPNCESVSVAIATDRATHRLAPANHSRFGIVVEQVVQRVSTLSEKVE